MIVKSLCDCFGRRVKDQESRLIHQKRYILFVSHSYVWSHNFWLIHFSVWLVLALKTRAKFKLWKEVIIFWSLVHFSKNSLQILWYFVVSYCYLFNLTCKGSNFSLTTAPESFSQWMQLPYIWACIINGLGNFHKSLIRSLSFISWYKGPICLKYQN